MTSIFDTQTVPIANNAVSALPWWRRWRDLERHLEYALVRDFFFLTPTLNNEQQMGRILLDDHFVDLCGRLGRMGRKTISTRVLGLVNRSDRFFGDSVRIASASADTAATKCVRQNTHTHTFSVVWMVDLTCVGQCMAGSRPVRDR
jgi:hypothetical protein